MKRRNFLSMSAAAGASLCLPRAFGAQVQGASVAVNAPLAASGGYHNLLILIELKGGNDGLNTVIPFADRAYYALRKNIAIQRDQALHLNERTGLHPALLPLLPLWRNGQLAIVEGVGYAQPNLSHFRSTEIWDTASRSDQYLRDGWLTRAFARYPVPAGFAVDGVVIGSAEMGPLANGSRAFALDHAAQFVNPARLATPLALRERHPSLAKSPHREDEAVKAAGHLRRRASQPQLRSAFPDGPFGNSIRTAMQVLAGASAPLDGQRVAVIRLTLSGFDTHHNQLSQQGALLAQLAQGLSALQAALVELGRWNDTLVMTYSEFGRRARENPSNGTDHGTAAPHFVMGARVRGGLYGVPPVLARLDGAGNLPVGVDFRRLHATVLGSWWGLDARAILQQRFEPLPLLRA